MEGNCLFCKLRSVKENIVMETENIYIICDRYPCSNRHLLLIFKEHQSLFHEYQNERLEEMIVLIKTLAIKLGFEKYNLLQNNVNGQQIPHCHFHLIEANETGCLKISSKSLELSEDDYRKTVEEVKGLLNKSC